MTLQSSGTISARQIHTEFGGSRTFPRQSGDDRRGRTIRMSNYRKLLHTDATSNTIVRFPNTGISFSDFYSKTLSYRIEVLVVGGGGGGGGGAGTSNQTIKPGVGGGGGAGSVNFYTNQVINSVTFNLSISQIRVGRGGAGAQGSGSGLQANNSTVEVVNSSGTRYDLLVAWGGAGGGGVATVPTATRQRAAGGGGGGLNLSMEGGISEVGDGGDAHFFGISAYPSFGNLLRGGGGGGNGGNGQDGIIGLTPGGEGGNAFNIADFMGTANYRESVVRYDDLLDENLTIQDDIDFIAGGGGGGNTLYNNPNYPVSSYISGKGGGGYGSYSISRKNRSSNGLGRGKCQHAQSRSGSGGGGGASGDDNNKVPVDEDLLEAAKGGNGGSGVVIIRYRAADNDRIDGYLPEVENRIEKRSGTVDGIRYQFIIYGVKYEYGSVEYESDFTVGGSNTDIEGVDFAFNPGKPLYGI